MVHNAGEQIFKRILTMSLFTESLREKRHPVANKLLTLHFFLSIVAAGQTFMTPSSLQDQSQETPGEQTETAADSIRMLPCSLLQMTIVSVLQSGFQHEPESNISFDPSVCPSVQHEHGKRKVEKILATTEKCTFPNLFRIVL